MNQRTGESELARPLEPGEARLFSEQNYEGQQQLIVQDMPSLAPDLSATSIQIGPQTGVTLFSEENYQGVSQKLTCGLAGFADSRLQDKKPKSVKVWSTVGWPFTGYWAIEVVEGQYLSVAAGGVLATRPEVRGSEAFRITDVGTEPGMVAFAVREVPPVVASAPEPSELLTIADLQKVALHNEPQAGVRKFSLMSANNQWISYDADQKRFLTTADTDHRTIFSQSIKIAEDEGQVGELHQGEVAFYENRAYWGKAWVFRTDCIDFKAVAGLDENVASIQVGPETGVTVYTEPRFNADKPDAPKQDVTSNVPSLEFEQVGENKITSMGIWKIVPHEGTGISFTCTLSQDFRRGRDVQTGKETGAFEEYSAYRTRLQLPRNAKSVDIWTTDETDIEIDTKTFHVSEDEPAHPVLGPTHCLVIETDAGVAPRAARKGSLSAPGLKIRTDSMLPHERIVIYPDQPVHERLAQLNNEQDPEGQEDETKDTLWKASYVTYEKKGQGAERVKHLVIRDRSAQKKTDVLNAQGMLTKLMSTVRYSGRERTISPDALQGKAWVLDFLTYRVTADILNVREAPDRHSQPVGFLRRNDVVEVLGFNVGASWIRLRRPTDGLTGWSSSTYLSQIAETPTQGEQYRVTATALHVRKGPGVDFSILGFLQQDEVVTAIGVNDKGTWRRIVTAEGLIGWSSAAYMTLVEAPRPAGITAAPQAVTPFKKPLPPVSELAPRVTFREVSQPDIQAVLARAQLPDAKLAQDFWSDIGDAFESAGSFFVTAFEDTVAFVIDIGGKAIRWIVDTAEKAIALVEGIIEKIGAAIEEIIKWLRFLFEWDDILETRDHLRTGITEMLDYAGRTLPQKAEGAVREFFRDKKGDMIGWFDQAIVALGGSPGNVPSGGSFSLPQMPESLDWILSKVMGGLGSFGSSNLFDLDYQPDPASEASLRALWDDTITHAANMVSTVVEGTPEVIISLVEHPDDPRQALAKLLQMLRNQLAGLLDIGEDLILALFRLAAYLCQRITEMLQADLRIPFISDLLKWVGELLGQDWDVTLGFSILDVATLILAIPVTIISKATVGEAPFKAVPALAMNAEVRTQVKVWGIVSGVAGFMGALFSIPLDMMPEEDKAGKAAATPQPLPQAVLELVSFMCALVATEAAWKAAELAALDEDAQAEKTALTTWMENILIVYDATILLLDVWSIFRPGPDEATITVEPPRKRNITNKIERFKRGNATTAVIATVLGVFHAAFFAARDYDQWNKVEDAGDAVSLLPDYLMTLPEVCSAIRLIKHPAASIGFAAVDGIAAGAAIGSAVKAGLGA